MIIDRTAIANSYMPPKRDEPPVDTPVQTEAQQLNPTTEETTTEERAAPATQENVVEEFEPATVAQPEPCDCVHIVVEGDTLWDIAERYTGNAFNYPELAKRSRIKNPHRIYPGDRVRIIIR
jgi:nucleoid-associated protein YgaU